MPYIGNTIRAADDYRLIDDISSGFNGSETSFALQVAGSAPVPFPKSPQQVLISVNGVIQEPDPTGSSGFNLVGTNIVFSSAPTNGHAFFGIIYATADYLNAGGNFPAGSLGAPSITFIGDENSGLYRKGGGSVGFVSDATEIANFDSNGITISSGNLIIPDSIIHNGDTNTKIRFPAADTVTIETAGNEVFRIDAGGDVGINRTDPTAKLHIVESASIPAVKIKQGLNSNQNASLQFFNDNGTGTLSLGVFGSAATTFGANEASDGFITANNQLSINAQNSSGQIRFGIGSTPNTKMIINSSGEVGIGTTSPSSLLNLDGGSSNAFVEVDGTGRYRGFEIHEGGSRKAYFHHDLTGNLSILNTVENVLAFHIGDTENMRLSATGLGIGTTNPLDKLHVNGGDVIISTASAPNLRIVKADNSSGGSTTRAFFGIATANNNFMNGSVDNDTCLVYSEGGRFLIGTGTSVEAGLDSSGNFGVGSPSPDSRIAIIGTGSDAVTRLNVTDGAGKADFNGRYGNVILNADRNNAVSGSLMAFKVDDNERMRITDSGAVGIGTSSPQCGLDYRGSEFRIENGSVPFIRLKATNAQSTNHFDYGRLINDVAGTVTGLLDWKRQNATDDSYFTIFNKETSNNIQERVRITSRGALCVHAAQQTNLNNMNVDSQSMPKYFENTGGQDSNLVGADIHFQTIIRGTSSITTDLFTFQGGGNCGFFCEVTAYFSSAVGDFQGRQRMWWRAFRTANMNFNITQAHNYDKVGSATGVYFNPLWTSSGSGANQVLGVRVQTANMGAYVRFWFVARIIAHDSMGSMTINR